MIDWESLFEHANPEKGASLTKTAGFVAGLGLPMTRAEIERVNATQRNPWLPTQPEHATWQPFDPGAWVMPKDRPVPPSYRSFVRYSDGGSFQNGDRLFQMWGTGLREFLLCYNVPQYMPLAVPFAFNGCGVMYLFDMREPPGAHGEYPIICAGAGCLTFDPHYSPKVADSFPEVCVGRFNVERLRFGGVVLKAGQWDTWTDLKPMLDDCEGQDRKLRLFACACARRVWDQMPDKLFRDAVELAEQVADDPLNLDEQRKALKEKCESTQVTPLWGPAAATATHCLGAHAPSAAWTSASTSVVRPYNSPEQQADRAKQADLLREIFGNPLRPVRVEPAWLTGNNRTVPQIAAHIYETNAFHDLPILADAVEEAGCAHAELLAHLRRPGGHIRGCWALDLLRDEPI